MMDTNRLPQVFETKYAPAECDTGVVHLGYGAFHRAHQAVYIDDYMDQTGDLRWGVAAVNLRGAESEAFARNQAGQNGYVLKSVAPDGASHLRRVRCHVAYLDWAQDPESALDILSQPSVQMATITVTESGYYTDPTGDLDQNDPVIASEAAGKTASSVYAYLAEALLRRMTRGGAPLTICCCDNIRQNGKMLQRNFTAYLGLIGASDLLAWVGDNVTFPCSMVDRITPRPTAELDQELRAISGASQATPILAETFSQWVLQDSFAADMPDLNAVGVTVTPSVDPFEETKIRVLNGGHTCLTYLAALQGLKTFDQAMQVPELFDHFWQYETQEVLPAITLDLPFSKQDYLNSISDRFKNDAIADTVARICSDGMAKFPIFIRPTIEGCLAQGIMPRFGIKSIASWYVFARHVAAGRIGFDYMEPSWALLEKMLGTDDFIMSRQLWGDLPKTYSAFAIELRAAITELEQTWPV